MAAITSAELLTKFTVVTGSAGAAVANTTVGTFLGNKVTSNNWAGGGTNDLFADLTGAQNAASQVDYAGIALHNSNTANAAQNSVVYLASEVAGGASAAVGVDTTAASAVGSASAQLVTIASPTTAPAGVTFSSPTTAATGVALGSVPVGNVRGVWVRRTAANTAPLSADGVTLGFSVDSGSL